MRTYLHQSLVSDGSLLLSIDSTLRDLASQWMPSLPEETARHHAVDASIRVDHQPLDRPELPGSPILALGTVSAWKIENGNTVWLESSASNLRANVDLRSRSAAVSVNDGGHEAVNDMTSMLTLVAALLLVRGGCTPVHAAGVVHPDSRRAWLLVGDSHSGKSTTTANLIRAGWSYLSDDYVVLRSDENDAVVEGWPDDFHLDRGWESGTVTGQRGTVQEARFSAHNRVATARLGGMLFPSVVANEPTRITPVSGGVALERLVRQSPWLIADHANAARVFELLARCATLPSADLRLGLDTYVNPTQLSRLVGDFIRETREPS